MTDMEFMVWNTAVFGVACLFAVWPRHSPKHKNEHRPSAGQGGEGCFCVFCGCENCHSSNADKPDAEGGGRPGSAEIDGEVVQKIDHGEPPVEGCGLGNPQSKAEPASRPTTGGAR